MVVDNQKSSNTMSQEPTEAKEEGAIDEPSSPLIQFLSQFKIKQISHLQFVLFGKS